MKNTLFRKTFTIALICILATGLLATASASEDHLIYSTDFANAAAVDGWTLDNPGDITFDNGGMHTKGSGTAYSQVFKWGADGMRVVVEFKFADPNFSDQPTSITGVAKASREHSDYEPRLVVCGTGFQVRMEGGYGTGDHWINDVHDFSGKPGVFSDTYIGEIIFSGRDTNFAVYDKSGKAIWIRPTPNRMMFNDEFTIYLGEMGNGGQTIFLSMKVYDTAVKSSGGGGGGGSAKTGDPFILLALTALPAAGFSMNMLRRNKKSK